MMQSKDKTFLHFIGDWWLARASAPTHVNNHPTSKAGSLLRWLMPNGGTLFIVGLFMLSQTVWADASAVDVASYPAATTINYQGELANAAGEPLTGVHSVTVAMFDSAENGNLLWGPETHAGVSVQNGRFDIAIGSQTADGLPTALWTGERYLEITVDNETLTPREIVRSVPVAGMALTVPDGSITSEKLDEKLFSAYQASASSSFWDIPQCGDSVNSNASYHQIPGMTIDLTLAKASTVLIDLSGLASNHESGKATYTNLFVNGVRSTYSPGSPPKLSGCRNSTVVTDAATDKWCPFHDSQMIELEAGQHTVSARAWCDGTDTAGTVYNGTLRAIVLP
ncbi:MAG: hypothetical protein ACPG8W_09035 [Candidatus Promineifilaceae bacterium]